MWGESMNVRFYHAAILTLSGERTFSLIQGELWVRGNKIAYIGEYLPALKGLLLETLVFAATPLMEDRRRRNVRTS